MRMNSFSSFTQKLARSSPGNIFFSPFTIMTALGMVYSGAQRNTEQEMKTVMNLSQDRISLHRAFKDVITDFQVCDYNQLSLETTHIQIDTYIHIQIAWKKASLKNTQVHLSSWLIYGYVHIDENRYRFTFSVSIFYSLFCSYFRKVHSPSSSEKRRTIRTMHVEHSLRPRQRAIAAELQSHPVQHVSELR